MRANWSLKFPENFIHEVSKYGKGDIQTWLRLLLLYSTKGDFLSAFPSLKKALWMWSNLSVSMSHKENGSRISWIMVCAVIWIYTSHLYRKYWEWWLDSQLVIRYLRCFRDILTSIAQLQDFFELGVKDTYFQSFSLGKQGVCKYSCEHPCGSFLCCFPVQKLEKMFPDLKTNTLKLTYERVAF